MTLHTVNGYEAVVDDEIEAKSSVTLCSEKRGHKLLRLYSQNYQGSIIYERDKSVAEAVKGCQAIN